MLTFFTHICTLQIWAAAGYQPHRVTAGMRIDAEKCFCHSLSH
jgi:hypothetical protein